MAWRTTSREVSETKTTYTEDKTTGQFVKSEEVVKETVFEIIAPNDNVYRMPSEEAAKAIINDFDQMAQRIARYEKLEAEAWLGAKEDALLQASAEFLDHFKQRDANMRAKRALGEKLE